MGALEAAIDPGLDVTVFDGDLGTHQFQAVDVQVDRTSPDGAAAGQGDVRCTETGGQGAKRQDGGAHGLDQLVGRDMVVDRSGQHGHVAVDLGAGPQHLQQFEGGTDVLEARHVGELDLFVTQQGGEQDGQGGVLGTRDGHFAIERATTIDLEFVHVT